MIIHKLKISHFKSFYEDTELDFDNLHGLYRVSGQIGSGKTTIGEAIIYGLYGSISGKNNADLISWGHKHGTVEIWLTSRGQNIYIKRELNSYGQSPMYVHVNGEPIVFTNKRNAQAQLEQDYLDTPRTTMELLCIISFNNFKSLSTLNTKDTKIFLDQVLGFDILTQYVDATKEEQSVLKEQLISLQASARAIQSQIERMESYEYIEGDPEALTRTIAGLKAELVCAELALQESLAPVKTKLEIATRRLGAVKALGQAKKKEIDFIKKGVCPTCGAPIDQSHLEHKEQERANLLEQFNEVSAQISDLQAQISTIYSESDKYVTEKKNAVKSQEIELARLQEQAKHTRINQDEIDKLKAELIDINQSIEHINTEYQEYDNLIQILQVQIRAKVLESFIPSINTKIREYAGLLALSYIPEYDSAFKCTVRSGDTRAIPTSSLSTGQLKMIDMVIILAILGSVVNKVQSNIIFLDELFSNLDPRTRADLIRVLRGTLPKDLTVLIVSHQDIDVELFDGHIKMKLENTSEGSATELSIEQKNTVNY